MARLPRTAKKVAQRIDLTYFKHPHPFRRWLWGLAAAAPAAAVLWLLGLWFAGSQDVYSSGPLSPAHAILADRCEICHVSQASVLRHHVTDQTCLTCHDGPLHNRRQVLTPRCGECHIEHNGTVQLAHTNDGVCTQCHAGLRVKEGSPEVATLVTGFNQIHPEFAPLRPGGGDPGAIKLNHEVHLKPDLRGPKEPVQMECADCHRPPAVRRPWPFGEAESQTVTTAERENPLAPEPVSAYMAPIQYAQHCVGCHPLSFDERFQEPVPHKKPDVVRAFVVRKFRDYIVRHPEELRRKKGIERRVPGAPAAGGPPVLTREQWMAEQVARAERLLWNKTCKECHTLNFSARALPLVTTPSLPVRWLPHSVFDHEAHRMLACASCHPRALSSKETSDVLLPGIQVCRQCHHQKGIEARCFECHEYHDWTQRERVKGTFSIQQLLKGTTVVEPSREAGEPVPGQ